MLVPLYRSAGEWGAISLRAAVIMPQASPLPGGALVCAESRRPGRARETPLLDEDQHNPRCGRVASALAPRGGVARTLRASAAAGVRDFQILSRLGRSMGGVLPK